METRLLNRLDLEETRARAHDSPWLSEAARTHYTWIQAHRIVVGLVVPSRARPRCYFVARKVEFDQASFDENTKTWISLGCTARVIL